MKQKKISHNYALQLHSISDHSLHMCFLAFVLLAATSLTTQMISYTTDHYDFMTVSTI